ncbi:MAG: putative toxin-antitoxin system toxin component, PIN family, partial [Bacteroidia bacterium]|nr:putative toxin-antitoxin system toxin component, PIN family [Bacteroidia bacterium]
MKKADFFVFDTNVLIGAMLMPESKCGLALTRGFVSGIVVISNETIEEANEAILKDKFEKYIPLPQRKEFLYKYEASVKLIIVSEHIYLCRDASDDKFLSLAKEVIASALITNDKDLLILNPFKNIP